ncbi:MAG TPA: hypothetical protein VFJ61_12635 [Solirubrobacterales bacterium]|nr:hypothetical protein [Solirubrobacterales bacterium]
MDDAYRAYFREHIDYLESFRPSRVPRRYGRLDPDLDRGPAHYLARGALERGLPSVELRPDAELLLYLLALEFVARPVTAVRGPDAARGELEDDLASDIAAVIETARQRSDDEITAHSVVDALSDRWVDLRTAGQNIWG